MCPSSCTYILQFSTVLKNFWNRKFPQARSDIWLMSLSYNMQFHVAETDKCRASVKGLQAICRQETRLAVSVPTAHRGWFGCAAESKCTFCFLSNLSWLSFPYPHSPQEAGNSCCPWVPSLLPSRHITLGLYMSSSSKATAALPGYNTNTPNEPLWGKGCWT